MSQIKNLLGQAAVLVLLRGHREQNSVLLAKRSESLRKHAGEVALPGGMWEPDDPSLQVTALREAHEEIAVPPESVNVIGELPAGKTRHGTRVTPYVGTVGQDVSVYPNSEEFTECFWVTKDELIGDPRIRTDIFHVAEQSHWAPVYEFSGHTVWGFTARVLALFANRYWGANIAQHHESAPTVCHHIRDR